MIRLLYQKPDGTFAFFSPRRRENHEYGMLSHVWQIDEEDEVTYQDILDNTGHTKLGYRKLQLCADWARHDGIRYFWCDTCCINQASSVEQNEAITCMFQWYAGAKRCWVYLKDVTRSIDNEPNVHWKSQFQRSSWFTRGWTLQELLAPPSVHFYSDDSAPLGDRNSLCEEISNRAAIPEEVIRNPSTRNNYSFEERMKWSQNRDTRFEEDGAYCLMGLWGVRFTPDYGESEVSAFQRLKKAIDKKAQAETPSLPAPPSQEEGKWSLDFMFVLDVVFKIFFTLTALAALYGVLPLEIRSAYVQYLPGLDVSVSVQSLAYTELNTSWPVFAILGKTGVGKSSFIDVLGARNLTTGLGPVVCEGLESCTEDYSFYAAQLDFGDVYVVDTPGFDDSKGRSDEDILISIWDELDRLYKGNTRLKGIIYLYDISAQRIGGMSARVLTRMQRLCGATEMSHLSLVTTHWARDHNVEELERQVKREQQLKEEYWGEAIKLGAHYERFHNTKKSASAILAGSNARKELFMPTFGDTPSDFREQERPIALDHHDKKPTGKIPTPMGKISTTVGKISTPVDEISAPFDMKLAPSETRLAPEDKTDGLCASVDATSFWTVSSHEFLPHWMSIWSLRSAASICADPKAVAVVLVLKSATVLSSQFFLLIASGLAAGMDNFAFGPRISMVVAIMGANWLLWDRSAVMLDTLADAGCTACMATDWHAYRLPALLYRACSFVGFLFVPSIGKGEHGFSVFVMLAIMVGCIYLQYTYVW